MSRLLGIIGPPPLPVASALKEFRSVCAPGNPDGWGVSGYNAHRAVYFERRAAAVDGDAENFEGACERAGQSGSPVIVAHFRRVPGGGGDIAGSHPFHYRDWVFAHAGDIFNPSDIILDDARSQGNTGGEKLMLWLIDRAGTMMNSANDLAEALRELRPRIRYDSLTFLLSNGKALWAYREAAGHQLRTGETLEDRENAFSLHWTALGESFVVCSEPLTALAGGWRSLPARSLHVFRPGFEGPEILPL